MPAYSLKFLVSYSYKAVGGMYTITFQLLKAMNVKKKKKCGMHTFHLQAEANNT